MGEAIVPLLAPFLVIGSLALIVGLIRLRARQRSIQRMQSSPTPQPQENWPGAPVEPLVERPVDVDRRLR